MAESARQVSRRHERTDQSRAMALGALVLIWGLFLGDGRKGLVLSEGYRIALLVAALGSVMVLLLDYVEHLMEYMAALQRIPGAKKMKPLKYLRWERPPMKPFNYLRWKQRSSISKHVFGSVGLLILIAVLAVILVVSVVHAQTASEMEAVKGHWCGSDQQNNNYMVLDIRFDNNTVTAAWGRDEACVLQSAPPPELSLWCGSHIELDVKPDAHTLVADWRETAPPAVGKNTLLDCPH